MFRTNKEEMELYELFGNGSRLQLFVAKLNKVIYPPLLDEEDSKPFEDIDNAKMLKVYYQRYVNDENRTEFWNTWDTVYRIIGVSCEPDMLGLIAGLEASLKAKTWLIKKTNEEKQSVIESAKRIIDIVNSINEEEPIPTAAVPADLGAPVGTSCHDKDDHDDDDIDDKM